MNRVIRKSQGASLSDAQQLLAGLFSAELCAPSCCLWLVSPWVSDVVLLDNAAGQFDELTRFGKRPVRLAEILASLASRGTHIVIGTTSDQHNESFLSRLTLLAQDMRANQNITVSIDETDRLHTKALTGDDFAIAGSMNITHNGITLREELIDLRTDEDYVAQARMDAFDRFGGVL